MNADEFRPYAHQLRDQIGRAPSEQELQTLFDRLGAGAEPAASDDDSIWPTLGGLGAAVLGGGAVTMATGGVGLLPILAGGIAGGTLGRATEGMLRGKETSEVLGDAVDPRNLAFDATAGLVADKAIKGYKLLKPVAKRIFGFGEDSTSHLLKQADDSADFTLGEIKRAVRPVVSARPARAGLSDEVLDADPGVVERIKGRILPDGVRDWWNKNLAVGLRDFENHANPFVKNVVAPAVKAVNNIERVISAGQSRRLSAIGQMLKREGVGDDRMAAIVAHVEGEDVVLSAGERKIAEVISRDSQSKSLLKQAAGVMTRRSGKRQQVPFTPKDNYWRHMPDTEVTGEEVGALLRTRVAASMKKRLGRPPLAHEVEAELARPRYKKFVEHRRVIEEGEYSTDISKVLERTAAEDPRMIANAAAFGGKVVNFPLADGSSVKAGDRVVAMYNRLRTQGLNKEADQLREIIGQRYGDIKAEAAGTGWLRQFTNGVLLTKVAITQGSQSPVGYALNRGHRGRALATKVMSGDGVRGGQAITLDDIHITGQTMGGMSGMMEGGQTALSGGKLKAVLDKISPGAATAKMENYNRGARTVSALGTVRRLAEESAELVNAGKGFSRAMEKEADELGIGLNRLAQEWNNGGGALSKSTYLEGWRNLANRQQFQLGNGEIGAAFKTPMGATLLHYRQFLVKQAHLFQDDVAAPLMEGIKSGDASLIQLAGGRLVRYVTLVSGATAGASAAKDLLNGNHPELLKLAGQIPGALGGIYGEVPKAIYNTAVGGPGFAGIEGLANIPVLDTGMQIGSDLIRGAYEGSGARLGRAAAGAAAGIHPSFGYLNQAVRGTLNQKIAKENR